MRRNLAFVDYVRDRKQADVHVLITSRRTSGGGVSYRIQFSGRGSFKVLQYELTYDASPTSTREERRRGLSDKLRLGLVAFASRTPVAEDLEVSYSRSSGEPRQPSPEKDPWNRWVFDIETEGRFNLQDRESSYQVKGSLAAERITSAWKIDMQGDGKREVDVFEREDTTDIRSTSDDFGLDTQVVKTLGPNSGTGLSASVFSRTFTNIQVGTRFGAAVEYNLFPYTISDQKELLFRYRIGPMYRTYREVTIFGKHRETLIQQSAMISLDLNRTWGEVFASIEASSFFHDFAKNNVEVRTAIDLELIEGFSFVISVNAKRIQDQLSLPAGDLSEEEVLLRRQERATSFRFWGAVGFSYTFGSIYSSSVNTRLER